MKRKVIQLAEKTLVVSLPYRWVKKQGVKKGDEIEVEEQGSRLSLISESNPHSKSTILDCNQMNERVMRWSLSALHKKGYDSIELVNLSGDKMKLLQEELKDLFIGFTITHQTKTTATIKAISLDVDAEFDTVLRRAFLVTLSLAESGLENINDSDALSDLLHLEKTNNQLTNFCERIINKKGFKKDATFFYVISWNLEKVCDEFKHICEISSKDHSELSKKVIDIYDRTNKLLRGYYELFYDYRHDKLTDLSEKRKTLQAFAKTALNSETGTNLYIVHHLLNAMDKISNFSASTVAINQSD